MGFEVFDPDMSMFTLGGAACISLCQALDRDEAWTPLFVHKDPRSG